jgi:hypothetical protein
MAAAAASLAAHQETSRVGGNNESRSPMQWTMTSKSPPKGISVGNQNSGNRKEESWDFGLHQMMCLHFKKFLLTFWNSEGSFSKKTRRQLHAWVPTE